MTLDEWTIEANGARAGRWRLWIDDDGAVQLQAFDSWRWVDVPTDEPIRRLLRDRFVDILRDLTENRRRLALLKSWADFTNGRAADPEAWPARAIVLRTVHEHDDDLRPYAAYGARRDPYALPAGNAVDLEVDAKGRAYAVPPEGVAHPTWRPLVRDYWVLDWSTARPRSASEIEAER
ncbi:MAG: hypothetical protein AAGE94_08340 [Acidobacteriota bacterium]